ncbi:uncharacterized protein V6R79_006327 [Siganus canaliculatus]
MFTPGSDVTSLVDLWVGNLSVMREMSVKLWSSGDLPPQSNLSSVSSALLPTMYRCLQTPPGSLIYSLHLTALILVLLPLCFLVFYLDVQRCRCQRSTAPKASTSDAFAHHVVAMELIGVSGYAISCCGPHTDVFIVFIVGYCFIFFIWYGETFFHILTCVERYLAAVHPVTYLGLRGRRGARLRDVAVGCVWLLSVGGASLTPLGNVPVVMVFFISIFSLLIISFCSLSVLCVLIRPRPGERGGARDRTKLRAFCTITAILLVLLLRCSWNVVWVFVSVQTGNVDCVLLLSEIWFNFPSSLVLPLLSLNAAGMFTCHQNQQTENQNRD